MNRTRPKKIRPYIVKSAPPTPEELGREYGVSPEHIESIRMIMNLPLGKKKLSSRRVAQIVAAVKKAAAERVASRRVRSSKYTRHRKGWG